MKREKNIKIEEEVHDNLALYCLLNGITIKDYLNTLIKSRVEIIDIAKRKKLIKFN